MNQLLPIIRRVRRPLLVADLPPVVVGNVEPVQVNADALKSNGNVEPVNAEPRTLNDAESASNGDTR